MKTVWVVEHGQYSDYSVVGVFSSKENAQLVADQINKGTSGYDDATIAEWHLDPAVKDLRAGRSMFLVHMLRDGRVETCEKQDFSAYEIAGGASIWRRSTAPAYRGQNIPDIMTARVFAKSAKGAIKSANEHRARLIASGEWL